MTVVPWPTDPIGIHAYALVKGVAEGDPYKHFGALGGIDWHRADAVDAGLLAYDKERSHHYTGLTLTAAGLAVYEDRLHLLPPGRANDWHPGLPGYPPENAVKRWGRK